MGKFKLVVADKYPLNHMGCTMKAIASLSLLIFVPSLVLGHGGHENSGPAAGETIQQYAQRHVRRFLAQYLPTTKRPCRCLQSTICNWLTIVVSVSYLFLYVSDSFDVRSFHALHDLNG